jgi:hypothetical protein
LLLSQKLSSCSEELRDVLPAIEIQPSKLFSSAGGEESASLATQFGTVFEEVFVESFVFHYSIFLFYIRCCFGYKILFISKVSTSYNT